MPHRQHVAPPDAYTPPITNEDLSARLAIVEERSERMERNLQQLVLLLQASKTLLTFIRWVAPIGALLIAAASYYRGPKG